MRHGIVGVVLLTIVAAGGIDANAQSGAPRIRPEGADVRELIDNGMERSATFRDLHAGLDDATVIVYVRFSPCSKGVHACLVWVSPAVDARRLLIKVDRFGRSPDELTALLAHELQHAREVASDPEITDLASFEKSFASRGWKHGAGFETGEAIRIAKTVSTEMSRTQGARSPQLGNQRIR